jgi:hypothetical protein
MESTAEYVVGTHPAQVHTGHALAEALLTCSLEGWEPNQTVYPCKMGVLAFTRFSQGLVTSEDLGIPALDSGL